MPSHQESTGKVSFKVKSPRFFYIVHFLIHHIYNIGLVINHFQLETFINVLIIFEKINPWSFCVTFNRLLTITCILINILRLFDQAIRVCAFISKCSRDTWRFRSFILKSFPKGLWSLTFITFRRMSLTLVAYLFNCLGWYSNFFKWRRSHFVGPSSFSCPLSLASWK